MYDGDDVPLISILASHFQKFLGRPRYMYIIWFLLIPDVYHTTFDWPTNPEVVSRLQEVTGNTEEDVVNRLVEYHRHIAEIIRCYDIVHKTVNADQPKADVFSQGETLIAVHRFLVLDSDMVRCNFYWASH